MRTARGWAPAGWVLAAVTLVAGCASTTMGDRRWEGHRIRELIASLGPADRIVSYPYGGTLYIWDARASSLAPPDVASVDDDRPADGVVSSRVFLVDDSGIIVRTQLARGDAAPDRLGGAP